MLAEMKAGQPLEKKVAADTLWEALRPAWWRASRYSVA